MAYDGRIMHRALERFEADRQARDSAFQKRREGIFLRQPRLREIEAELSATVSRIIASALRRGADPLPAVEVLREENLGLQAERRELLSQMGLPENALEERPACPLCGDTGYQGGKVCRCLRRYYVQEQKADLSRMLDLGNQSFETFSLDWYSPERNPLLGISPRENMEWVYHQCLRYAEQFEPGCGNLLLTGDPGLGKTFLSAAIARVVSDRGYSVVYDTAGHIFQCFEAEKFGREESGADVERVLTCDLLILDDLGTEMTTTFVQSALYQILNTRLIEHRSTILSTNLRVDDQRNEISRRYLPQIASRIQGEYQILPFFGEDIRKLKKERQ